jgi:iron complex transport system ATP-binding protein
VTLILEKVKCGYGGRVVLDGFSAEIHRGDVFCLLGPNGIGKTTLFKTILGFIPLMGGNIICDEKNIREITSREYAKLIGYVPQAHSPPFAFTVYDVVVMGRIAYQGIFGVPRKEDYMIAMGVMERLDILFLKDRIYTELSGGERQMVLVARALAQQPAFLLMDEPTANLDFGNQARVLKNIKKLAREGLGIVMTTHSPDQVFQCNADVALLKPGGDYICGRSDDVLAERNLLEAYGIEVAVIDASYRTEKLRICRPIIDSAENTAEGGDIKTDLSLKS